MADKDIEIILSKVLGTMEGASIQQFILYVPHRDKNGKPIKNLKQWIKNAQKILTFIGGGSTTLPPADGTWLNPENHEILWEKTTLIYTYVDADKFEENLGALRKFLHRFGRETNQGEVVFEFDGRFYRIRKYDAK